MSTSHAAAQPARADPRSASAIAEFKKKRLRGDYGKQPNAPSIGIKMEQDAFNSANKATSSTLGPVLWYPSRDPVAHRASELAHASENLGPRLWYPTATVHAQTASTAATANQSSVDAIYVEDPSVRQLASLAATSASQTPGEVYGERHNPEAYKFARRTSNAAAATVLARQPSPAEEQSQSINAAMAGAHKVLEADRAQRAQAQQAQSLSSQRAYDEEGAARSMDYTKIMAAAQKKARARLANAGPPQLTPDPQMGDAAMRREQVLALITIADQRVKKKMAELDHDTSAQVRLFGSPEHQRIAMDVAASKLAGRLDNHGKVNLGGGLYMNPDEIDDIARQHVQPVLDKVDQVAQKKRIVDRETAARTQLQKKAQEELRDIERLQRGDEKAWQTEAKAQAKQEATFAKQRSHQQTQRAKKPPTGELQATWANVETLKEDVKQAKTVRGDLESLANRAARVYEQRKTDLSNADTLLEELRQTSTERAEEIETLKQSDEPGEGGAESVALFEKQQELETLNLRIKLLQQKRSRLETVAGQENTRTLDARKRAADAHDRHHELKKQYFDQLAEAEAAQKKFDEEEQARKAREAEAAAQAAAERREAEAAAAQAAAERREAEAAAAATAGTAAAATVAAGAAVAGTAAAASTETAEHVLPVETAESARAVPEDAPTDGYVDHVVATTPGAEIAATEKTVQTEVPSSSSASAASPASPASPNEPAPQATASGPHAADPLTANATPAEPTVAVSPHAITKTPVASPTPASTARGPAAGVPPDLRGFNRDGSSTFKNFFKMFKSKPAPKRTTQATAAPIPTSKNVTNAAPTPAAAPVAVDEAAADNDDDDLYDEPRSTDEVAATEHSEPVESAPAVEESAAEPIAKAEKAVDTSAADSHIAGAAVSADQDTESSISSYGSDAARAAELVSAGVPEAAAAAVRAQPEESAVESEPTSPVLSDGRYESELESKASLSNFHEARESVSDLKVDDELEHKGLELARTKSAESTSTVRPGNDAPVHDDAPVAAPVAPVSHGELATSASVAATAAAAAATAAAAAHASTPVSQAKSQPPQPKTQPKTQPKAQPKPQSKPAPSQSLDSIDDQFKGFDSSNVEEPIDGVFKENFDK